MTMLKTMKRKKIRLRILAEKWKLFFKKRQKNLADLKKNQVGIPEQKNTVTKLNFHTGLLNSTLHTEERKHSNRR